MGIKTVAVHSTADADAMHVRLADEAVCIGPPRRDRILPQHPNIISAAEISGADAIHPGYGFLSENARFAEIVEAHGIILVGPKPEHIRTMGDKIEAKRTAARSACRSSPDRTARFQRYRGGQEDRRRDRLSGDHQGRLGRRRARHEGRAERGPARNPDGQAGSEAARRRSATRPSTWKNISAIRATSNSRSSATATAMRSISASATARCSAATRRCWKKPLAVISVEERNRMGGIVAKAMADMGYRGAGTIEFLWEAGEFYFIEMNTRCRSSIR
jgi:acetyl-CoA carboxylase biotin carboxylase subunit